MRHTLKLIALGIVLAGTGANIIVTANSKPVAVLGLVMALLGALTIYFAGRKIK